MGKIAKQYDVTGANTVSDMLARSGTGFDMSSAPVVVNGREVEGSKAIVRADTGAVLGIVGDRFRINSHVSQLEQLQTLVASGFMAPRHVSVWDNGAKMAFQFSVPSLDVDVGGGDITSPLLTLAFGLDGSFSDRTFLAKFRWFCTNQMGKVREASQGMAVRHVGANVERYAELVRRHVLSLTDSVMAEADIMRRMSRAPLRGKDILGFFAAAVGAEDIGSVVEDVWTHGNAPEKLRGHARTVRAILDDYKADTTITAPSVWRAYNGVTRYVTHSEGRNPATRSERALLGSATIERAWEAAAKLAA